MEAESTERQLVPLEQQEDSVQGAQGQGAGQQHAGGDDAPVEPAAALPQKTQQKAVVRRTVDYTSPYLKLFQARLQCPNVKDASMLQPILAESLNLLPPAAYLDAPASNLTTKFVIGNLNKAKSSINHAMWTPDGRRCMTGATSGEFTVWDGRTFNWESVLQAHEAPVRCMQYTHNEHIIISSDDNGRIKLWNGRKDNFLDPLHFISAHREPCRSISIAPTDRKFVSASDDSTIKVHDFVKGGVETTMMGHGGDVRWVDWHPRMGLIASGSKDALAKMWDPRSGGSCVATLHGHKNGIMQVKWNPNNANWLLTASRDQTLKIFDLRTLREIGSYQGHTRDVTCCAWHPLHEELFVSGSYDGGINYWLASRPDPQAVVQGAHDKEVWSLAWHPVGHLLASGSSDLSTKFWCRPRPGDVFQDRQQDEQDGLGLGLDLLSAKAAAASAAANAAAAAAAAQPAFIPGLGSANTRGGTGSSTTGGGTRGGTGGGGARTGGSARGGGSGTGTGSALPPPPPLPPQHAATAAGGQGAQGRGVKRAGNWEDEGRERGGGGGGGGGKGGNSGRGGASRGGRGSGQYGEPGGSANASASAQGLQGQGHAGMGVGHSGNAGAHMQQPPPPPPPPLPHQWDTQGGQQQQQQQQQQHRTWGRER